MRTAPHEFLARRRILYGKGADRAQRDVAAILIAEGRLAEALEFLERCRDAALLARVAAAAVAAGDAFALQRAGQIAKSDPAPDEWRALAVAAEAKGRYYDAIRALEKAGDTDRSEALRLERHPNYVPFRPQGK